MLARQVLECAAAFALLLVALLSSSQAAASVWPSSHERVAQALKSDDAAERRAAARDLAGMPPEIARPLARQALLDPDVDVRLFAAQASAALGVTGAGDIVVSWLSAAEPRLRAAACELIEVSPTARSVQALARVLGDANPNVRRAAAAAMGSSGSTDVVAPLLGHLDDNVVAVRLEVVRALGRIGDRRAVVPLVSKLQDAEPEVREAAARALAGLGDPRAVATLMLALQDSSGDVQIQALEALGALRASDAISAIAALLGGAEQGEGQLVVFGPVRDAALRALGRIGTSQAVGILVNELARPGAGPPPAGSASRAAPEPVRQALVLAGDAAVEPLLRALRAAPSPQVASGAALTLAELDAKQAVPDVVRAAQRGTVSLDAAFLSLAVLDDRRALPFVVEHLDDPDPRVRRLAVEVAGQLLDPRQADGRLVDPVRPRVLDLRTAMAERVALVGLLGRTGSVRAQQLLLSLARSKQPALRAAVVEALGELGRPSPAVDRVLLEALSEPSAALRLAAATALARVGKDGAAAKLLHALGVGAEQDRGAIGVALSGSLSRSKDDRLVARARAALAVAPAAARDALLEGLGRMPVAAAGRLLSHRAGAADADDRRKVAEALAGHPKESAALRRLLADSDPAVRANAAWSLGRVGGQPAVAPLRRALTDLDVAVAGNAAVALARVARRQGTKSAAQALCGALDDYRSYVRANALVGLRWLGADCPAGRVRHMLLRDRSWRVRLAAADLLGRAAAGAAVGERSLDGRALRRCATEDKDRTVAAHCQKPRPPAAGSEDVLVFVVPHGRTEPLGRAPYALERADGALRLGVADRRGALFEHGCPKGSIQLAVPAALAR